MKTLKITYWISTIIIAVIMTYSGFAYLTKPEMVAAFTHLGFPAYFRNELAFAKFIGVFLLLVPVFDRAKQWAYAGFAITFISAFIAHTSSGDPGSVVIVPVIFFALLMVSYITHNRLLSEMTLPLNFRQKFAKSASEI